jgi:hypothetical protein
MQPKPKTRLNNYGSVAIIHFEEATGNCFVKTDQMIIPSGLLFPNDGKDHRKEKLGLFLSFPIIMGIVVGFVSQNVMDGLKVAGITAAIIGVVAAVVFALTRLLNGLAGEVGATPKIKMSELFALLFVGAGLVGGLIAVLN